mgnify:CR=1 FL=1
MQFQTDIKGLDAYKKKLAQLANLSELQLIEAVARPIENATQDALENETDPWGNAWVNQDSPTYNHLNKTNSMHSSLHSTVNSKREAVVGMNAVSKDGYNYPAVQQFGTKDKKVPARSFFPIDLDGNLAPDVESEIEENLNDLLESIFND